jgi:hypothetical protein
MKIQIAVMPFTGIREHHAVYTTGREPGLS